MDQERPHDIIVAAQQALETAPEVSPSPLPRDREIAILEAPMDLPVMPYEASRAPQDLAAFQKFNDVPSQLRDDDGVNIYEIKKLNLAAAVEALERTIQSHESFPTPEASFAVASLSEQVQKLTRDLERSQDPKLMFERIVTEVLHQLTMKIVQTIAIEGKWIKTETRGMVIPEKAKPFDDTINTAINHVGPALSEGLEHAKTRLLNILQIKKL